MSAIWYLGNLFTACSSMECATMGALSLSYLLAVATSTFGDMRERFRTSESSMFDMLALPVA